MSTRISVVIPAAVKQTVLDSLTTALDALAPYLHPLGADQRQGIVKMGDKSLGFMQDVVQHGTATPALVPSFVDFKVLKQNVQATSDLEEIYTLFMKGATDVESTKMQTGGAAYTDGLLVYKHAQNASKANVPGAQAALEDMAKRFERQPAVKKSKKDA